MRIVAEIPHGESHAAMHTTGGVAEHAEAAVVIAAQRGNREAFSQLVVRYQATVYGYLRARLLSAADVEDLSQEVFLRCLMGHDQLDRVNTVAAWLIGIARNVLREYVRRAARRREVAWTELCLELESYPANVIREEHTFAAQLPHCLESLGPSARTAIDLRYQAQLGLEEIARRLSRSEGAVKLLMHRARQALKHCLEKRVKLTAPEAPSI